MSFFSLLRSCFRSPAAMLVLMLGLTIGMGGVSGYYLAANLAGSGSTGSSSSVPSPFRATAWKHFEPVFSAIPQNPSADWCEAYSPQCRGVNIPYNAQYPGAPTSGLSSLQIWCRDFDNRCLTPLANAGLPYNLNLPVPGSTAIGPGAMGYWCENDAEPICDAYEGQRTRTPHGSYCNNYWDTCTSEPLPHPTEDPLFEEYFTQHGTVGWVPDERQTTVPPPGYIGNNVDPYLFLPLTPTTVPQSPSSDWCEAYRPQCLGVNAPVGGFPNYSGPVPQWCIDFNTRCDDHLRRAGYLGGTSLAPAFGGDPLWCTQEAHQVCAWDGLGRRRVVNNSNCNTYWNSCTSEPLPPVERDPTFAHLYPPPNTSSQSTSSSGGSSSQNSNVSTSRPEPSPELQARIDAFFANRRSASAQTSQSASGSASGQVSTDASGAGSSAQGSGATRIQIPRELLDFTAHVQSLSAGGDVQPTQDFARLNRITGLDINFEQIFSLLQPVPTLSSRGPLSGGLAALFARFRQVVEGETDLLEYRGSVLPWAIVYKLYALSHGGPQEDAQNGVWFEPYEDWFKLERPEYANTDPVDPVPRQDVLRLWNGALPAGVTPYDPSGAGAVSPIIYDHAGNPVQVGTHGAASQPDVTLNSLDDSLFNKLSFSRNRDRNDAVLVYKDKVMPWAVVYKLLNTEERVSVGDITGDIPWFKPHEDAFKQRHPEFANTNPIDPAPEGAVRRLWNGGLPQGAHYVRDILGRPVNPAAPIIYNHAGQPVTPRPSQASYVVYDHAGRPVSTGLPVVYDHLGNPVNNGASEVAQMFGESARYLLARRIAPALFPLMDPVARWIDTDLPRFISRLQELARELDYAQVVDRLVQENDGFRILLDRVLHFSGDGSASVGSSTQAEHPLDAIRAARMSLLDTVQTFLSFFEDDISEPDSEPLPIDETSDFSFSDCSQTDDGLFVDIGDDCP